MLNYLFIFYFLLLASLSTAQHQEIQQCEHDNSERNTHYARYANFSAFNQFFLSPDTVTVNTLYDVEIIHILDSKGLKKNDKVRIQFPSLWTEPQDTNSKERNFVSVYTSRFGALSVFDFISKTAYPITGIKTSRTYTSFFTLLDYELFSGDTLIFRYGSKKSGGKGQITSYLSGTDYFYADIQYADGLYSEISKMLVHEIPADPFKIMVFSFSNPTPNLSSPLKIIVTDKYNNPSIGYTGTIGFSNLDGTVELPASYTFQPADSGRKVFYITFKDTLVHRLKVQDENNLSGISNPVLPKNSDKLKIWWGDMHTHSLYSNHGTGMPEQLFYYGKNVTGLDFLVYSEHSYINDSLYAEGIKISNRYNKDNEFITLNGYEWSAPIEHKIVFYKDWNPPIFRDSIVGKLFLSVATNGGSIIAAHPTSSLYYTNWDSHNPDVQHNSEITGLGGSLHEYPNPATPGSSVQEALARNFVFGFVGSSDNHHSRPGKNMSSFSKQSEVGITAVFANELTREKLFESLNIRSNYATTGERILLDFRINNNSMGNMITITGKFPELSGTVHGQDTLGFVDIIKNNVILKSFYPGTRDFQFQLSDTSFSKESYYYLRVLQKNGHRAWSSPVWVSSSSAIHEETAGNCKKCVDIYPNPGERSFFLKCNFSSTELLINLSMYDMIGNIIQQDELKQSTFGMFTEFVSLPALNPGIYLVQLKYLDETITKKLVVID